MSDETIIAGQDFTVYLAVLDTPGSGGGFDWRFSRADAEQVVAESGHHYERAFVVAAQVSYDVVRDAITEALDARVWAGEFDDQFNPEA